MGEAIVISVRSVNREILFARGAPVRYVQSVHDFSGRPRHGVPAIRTSGHPFVKRPQQIFFHDGKRHGFRVLLLVNSSCNASALQHSPGVVSVHLFLFTVTDAMVLFVHMQVQYFIFGPSHRFARIPPRSTCDRTLPSFFAASFAPSLICCVFLRTTNVLLRNFRLLRSFP